MRMRAQVIFQGGTAIPEDRFINTFHFASLGETDLATKAAATHPQLVDFYNNATTGAALGTYISKFVLRPFTIRYYDLDALAPRVPVILTGTLPAATAGVALPEEVAVCLSFHGVPPVTPRRRGRIYFGPLQSAATDDATATTQSAVNAALRAKLAQRGSALAAGSASWAVYSPTTDDMIVVDAGFVDNAFDTQRRRGGKATARTVWT